MPVNPPSNLKGTSPSKNIQRGNDTAWGAQKGTTSPKEALSGAHNKHPLPVKGSGK